MATAVLIIITTVILTLILAALVFVTIDLKDPVPRGSAGRRPKKAKSQRVKHEEKEYYFRSHAD